MQKITLFLWFNGRADDAAKFYTSVFKNSKVRTISRYGDAGPGPKGSGSRSSSVSVSGSSGAARCRGLSSWYGQV